MQFIISFVGSKMQLHHYLISVSRSVGGSQQRLLIDTE